jgi:hypothetical protein
MLRAWARAQQTEYPHLRLSSVGVTRRPIFSHLCMQRTAQQKTRQLNENCTISLESETKNASEPYCYVCVPLWYIYIYIHIYIHIYIYIYVLFTYYVLVQRPLAQRGVRAATPITCCQFSLSIWHCPYRSCPCRLPSSSGLPQSSE